MVGMAKGAEKEAPDAGKLEKVKKAAASRAKGGKTTKNTTTRYIIWVGASIGSIVVACLVMVLNPDRGPWQTPVNDQGLIMHINRNAKTWRAGGSSGFEGWTLGDARMLEGVSVSGTGGALAPCQVPADVGVPDSFDLRQKFPQCFKTPVYSMGNCTASWAIASASSLANRFCISNEELYGDLALSPQDLLSCDKNNRGCSGGDLDTVWNYISQTGLVTESCFPYQADSTVPCQQKCTDQEPLKGATHCILNTEANIKREIFLNGPVVAPVFLMNDFLVYRGGLYQGLQTAAPLIDDRRQRIIHAVKIIGWGTMEGKKYWLIENSWGSDWGEDGYAKVLVGTSESDRRDLIMVENYVLAGTPLNKKVEEASDDADSDFEEESMEEVELPGEEDM